MQLQTPIHPISGFRLVLISHRESMFPKLLVSKTFTNGRINRLVFSKSIGESCCGDHTPQGIASLEFPLLQKISQGIACSIKSQTGF
jgi:hypothetical protein